jgi:hypothetical protein
VEHTDSDLHFISAGDAIRAFKAKELSPVELLQAVIDRIEETNESVNCLTYTYFDRALAQAAGRGAVRDQGLALRRGGGHDLRVEGVQGLSPGAVGAHRGAAARGRSGDARPHDDS